MVKTLLDLGSAWPGGSGRTHGVVSLDFCVYGGKRVAVCREPERSSSLEAGDPPGQTGNHQARDCEVTEA